MTKWQCNMHKVGPNIYDDEPPKLTELTEENKIVTPIVGEKFYDALCHSIGISLARISARVLVAFVPVKNRGQRHAEKAHKNSNGATNSTKPYNAW